MRLKLRLCLVTATISAVALIPLSMPALADDPVTAPYATGFRPPWAFGRYSVQEPALPTEDLPSQWDWRAQGEVTPVKYQGACGTCSIFATLAGLESRMLLDADQYYDLSENNVKECNSTGCDATNAMEVVSFLAERGAALESCDPYQATPTGVCVDCPPIITPLGWYQPSTYEALSTEVLKSYVYLHGPVHTAIYSSFPEFTNYDGTGVLVKEDAPPYTDHAVLIVGWDDSLAHAGGTGAWIIKNSWGQSWGDGGYLYLAYGSCNVGWYTSFFTAWKEGDEAEELLLYDEGGLTAWWTANDTEGWGASVFPITSAAYATHVEFWTFDEADVSVTLYRGWGPMGPETRMTQSLSQHVDLPGYHSVEVFPVRVAAGDSVAAVVQFNNRSSTMKVVPCDWRGTIASGRTFFSHNGYPGSWEDASDYSGGARDVGIRLRTTTTRPDLFWLHLPVIMREG